jgi:hypothetical protein
MFHLVCYLREEDRVFETYWTNGRGVEAIGNSTPTLSPAPPAARAKGVLDLATTVETRIQFLRGSGIGIARERSAARAPTR